jgi:hypothetical protein
VRVRILPGALLIASLVLPAASASLPLYFGDAGPNSNCRRHPLLLESPDDSYACHVGPATAMAGQPGTAISYTFTTRDAMPDLDSGGQATVVLRLGGAPEDLPQQVRLRVNATVYGPDGTQVLGEASGDCDTSAGTAHCEFPFQFAPVRFAEESDVAVGVTFEQAVGAATPAIRIGGPDPSRIDFPDAARPTAPSSGSNGGAPRQSPLWSAPLLPALAAAALAARRLRTPGNPSC